MSGEVGAQSDSAPLYPVAMDLLLSLAIMGRGGGGGGGPRERRCVLCRCVKK